MTINAPTNDLKISIEQQEKLVNAAQKEADLISTKLNRILYRINELELFLSNPESQGPTSEKKFELAGLIRNLDPMYLITAQTFLYAKNKFMVWYCFRRWVLKIKGV